MQLGAVNRERRGGSIAGVARDKLGTSQAFRGCHREVRDAGVGERIATIHKADFAQLPSVARERRQHAVRGNGAGCAEYLQLWQRFVLAQRVGNGHGSRAAPRDIEHNELTEERELSNGGVRDARAPGQVQFLEARAERLLSVPFSRRGAECGDAVVADAAVRDAECAQRFPEP